MRVAIAGVSLDFALGSVAVGSSVSMGAKVSPSRPMPSNNPPADESTASDSARKWTEVTKVIEMYILVLWLQLTELNACITSSSRAKGCSG